MLRSAPRCHSSGTYARAMSRTSCSVSRRSARTVQSSRASMLRSAPRCHSSGDVRSGDVADVVQPPRTAAPASERASSAHSTRPALGLGPPLKRDAPVGEPVSVQRVPHDSPGSVAHSGHEATDSSAHAGALTPDEQAEPSPAGDLPLPSALSKPALADAGKTPSPVEASADIAPLLGVERSTADEPLKGSVTEARVAHSARTFRASPRPDPRRVYPAIAGPARRGQARPGGGRGTWGGDRRTPPVGARPAADRSLGGTGSGR